MTDAETARAQSFAMLIDLGTKLQALADREFAGTGLTTRQWFLCLVLERAGASLPLGRAALRMGTSRQNAKQLALKLEKKGFLRIDADPEDGRALRLSLTEACAAFWDRRTAEDRAFLERVFSALGADETVSLRDSLAKLVGSVQDRLADGSSAFEGEQQ